MCLHGCGHYRDWKKIDPHISHGKRARLAQIMDASLIFDGFQTIKRESISAFKLQSILPYLTQSCEHHCLMVGCGLGCPKQEMESANLVADWHFG